MYLIEIAPVAIRGAMGVLCPLGITVGVLLGQIMGLKFLLGSYLNIYLFLILLMWDLSQSWFDIKIVN